MENSSNSVVQPDVLQENKLSIHSFLRTSYKHAKRQMLGGINAFKDELRGIRNTAEACFDFFAAPINNYLKDIAQIDQEFQQGLSREPGNTTLPFKSIKEALSTEGPMEENY